jgi:PadR family transcriptional regulator, regulatory protein AphA
MNQIMSIVPATSSAETLRLTPVSCLVLGLIGLRGASSPYDLKKAANRSVSYFWPFPHSQLYDEPERLAAAGLLERETETTGRRRKLYSLTKDGHDALRQWLQAPPDAIFEMRDMAVLQLFFSEFMSQEELENLARRQIALYRERLATYREIEKTYVGEMGRNRRMSPLFLGVRMATACLNFWEDIAENPPLP